jgi:membrane protein
MRPELTGWRFPWAVGRESVVRFLQADALTYAAALGYTMVFSLPPLLLVVLWVAGFLYQEAPVRTAVFSEIEGMVGADGAQKLMGTVESLNIQAPSLWASVIAAGTLLFAASAALIAGQNALNRILGVTECTRSVRAGIWITVRQRIFSFAILITIGFLLSVMQVLSALITLFGKFLVDRLGAVGSWLAVFDSALLDSAAMTVIFALLFRYLPDVRMKWREIWRGALLTAVLFAVGEHLIGFVIGRSKVATYYDAAGSLLVLMLWFYFSSAIFLFGGAFIFTHGDLLAKRRRNQQIDQVVSLRAPSSLSDSQ